MTAKVLIIDAGIEHGHSHGKLNHHYVNLAQQELSSLGYQHQVTRLEEDNYDIATEVNKIAEADFLIIQTPGWWMSTPWQLKKYQDTVFGNPKLCGGDGRSRDDSQKRYGSGGFLIDKCYMLSCTWNAPLEAFNEPDQFFEGRGIDGVFFPLHKTFEFLGLKKLPTFMANDVVKNPQHEKDFARFIEHIRQNFPALK